MTVQEYIKKYGWQADCKIGPCKVMSVNIDFLDPNRRNDQTQFDIAAYDKKELEELFSCFCKENHFPENTVTGITIVQIANAMEDLL